jgi:hypothetical protein
MSEQAKSNVKDTEIYNLLTSLVIHSEQVRWTRLNTFLVIASIFLAAWAGIFVGTEHFQYKQYLLFVLCAPGIVLGVMWAVLGWRSSQYMDDFHDSAHKMEEVFDTALPKPLHLSEGRRKSVRTGMIRYTSSKWLVAAVPLLFTFLFLSLAVASFTLVNSSTLISSKPKPFVVLDGWWNADFAKETCARANNWRGENAALISQVGCDKVTSCREMAVIVEACMHDPVQQVREFEAELTTQFAADAECSSVQLVYFKSPDEKNKAVLDTSLKERWNLGLNFSPGSRKQQWSIVHSPDHSASMQGKDEPIEIARKVCTIVRQRGATLVN